MYWVFGKFSSYFMSSFNTNTDTNLSLFSFEQPVPESSAAYIALLVTGVVIVAAFFAFAIICKLVLGD